MAEDYGPNSRGLGDQHAVRALSNGRALDGVVLEAAFELVIPQTNHAILTASHKTLNKNTI